jgi:murein DD-endopeptidase MepM/ murein hydrolase activator NlpD
LKVVLALLSVPALVVVGGSFYRLVSAESQLLAQAALARQEAQLISAQLVQFTERAVPAGRTVSDFLVGMGVAPQTVHALVHAARPVYNLARLRAGNRIAVGYGIDGALRAVRYQIDSDRMLWVTPRGDEFQAEIKTIPSTMETVRVTGEVRDSLFNAVEDIGERAELAIRLADIFGWDLDFYTDPRPGDTFRVVIEKKTYLNGQPPTYGKLLAAEYKNENHPYQAVLFRDPSGKEAYYAPDGKSLQKAFLRSPLEFSAPITSRFSRSRFHPILKRHRPHLGIDYGAPIGAPVQSIGEGRVVFAGYKGQSGNIVHVRHSNGYETMYMHLSRILVRPGARVAQGERIGLVGKTGLATGPHLDFRVLQNGQYRNFEALRLPPAQPVAKREWADFVAARDLVMPLLTGDGIQFAKAQPGPAPVPTTNR